MANTLSTTRTFTAARPSAGPTRSSPTPRSTLVLHGERFTLAVAPVTRSESLKQVLQELLLVVSKRGLKIGLLLLDRGFYSVEVIRYLQQARRPFLMPMVCHGRKADHPLGPSGSNVFKAMKKSGWYTHTLQDAKKNQATVSVCVKRARCKNKHGKTEERDVGVRLLGDRPEAGGLGEGHVPAAVRDRDELSSNEPMSHPHDDQEVPCAVLLCGDRVVAEEPVGVAALLSCCRARAAGVGGINWDLLRVERMLIWLEEVAKSMYGLVVTSSNRKIYTRISSVLSRPKSLIREVLNRMVILPPLPPTYLFARRRRKIRAAGGQGALIDPGSLRSPRAQRTACASISIESASCRVPSAAESPRSIAASSSTRSRRRAG